MQNSDSQAFRRGDAHDVERRPVREELRHARLQELPEHRPPARGDGGPRAPWDGLRETQRVVLAAEAMENSRSPAYSVLKKDHVSLNLRLRLSDTAVSETRSNNLIRPKI